MNSKKLLLATATIGLLVSPSIALAQFDNNLEEFQGTADAAGDAALIDAIRSIVNSLLSLAALIAAIFVVIGGVRYITSQGDEDAAAGAKNTILYAAIGIIVILLSAVLVNFIIGSVG